MIIIEQNTRLYCARDANAMRCCALPGVPSPEPAPGWEASCIEPPVKIDVLSTRKGGTRDRAPIEYDIHADRVIGKARYRSACFTTTTGNGTVMTCEWATSR